jgi:UDP-N-acetylglucosamine 2-epimerase (non-hydrolysing)
MTNNKSTIRLLSVVGARPNFIKIAPIVRAINEHNRVGYKAGPGLERPIRHTLVHTGQHYDIDMSDAFFQDLGLPNPDINMEVGSSSHAVQTANIMVKFEQILIEEKPDWIIVVGDVNSTLAAVLVSSKMGIKSAHVEAGLRSFDRSMPEEINRIITDAVANLLFTPSPDADENLLNEGVSPDRIKRVGNVMIDTLVSNLERARRCRVQELFGMKEKDYVFVTLHRPSNVDDIFALSSIIEHLMRLSERIPVIFPMHPRTGNNISNFGLQKRIKDSKRLIICNPLGYHDTIGLVDKARLVLTDSGGLQEETTFLNIPCLTLRPNTERPITITQGTNRLTSLTSLDKDINVVIDSGDLLPRKAPEFWDGHTAERIIRILVAAH